MRAIPAEQVRAWSEGLRASDHDAYRALYEATYTTLFRYAWYFTRDREAANDVLQDVYLKLWQVRATIDPDRSLRALLYQMVRNYALNQQRSKQRRALSSLDDVFDEPLADESTETDLHTKNLQARIETWINELPRRRREAFQLSRYEGLSHQEIAQIMGLTPKTVNNHIVLALQHLRGKLRDYEPNSIAP